MENSLVVNAGASAPVKVIWLHPDGEPKPYLHTVDGDCDCKSCESKIRRIILPYAA